MSDLFSHRTALVTGASSGIGRAMAVALGREGATLHLVGRNEARLDSVAAAVTTGTSDASVHVHPLDLTDHNSADSLVERLQQSGGKLDILIHSAGATSIGTIKDTPVEELDRQYAINVRAPYELTRGLLPLLTDARGDVVFINSSVTRYPRAGVGAYAATKSGLKSLADSLRDEINADGVRVLSVHPGRSATPMQESLTTSEGREYNAERLLQPEDIAATITLALALPRTAEVTDIYLRPAIKS